MSILYHIDLAWLEENKRPLLSLASSRLCGEEHPKLRPISKARLNENGLFQIFQECCSLKPEFVTAGQPLMESLFRIFLAAGNKAMSVQEISGRLRDLRGERLPEGSVLELLLERDSFYGFRRLPDEKSG